MKGIINVIFFIIALQSACYLCAAFQVFGTAINYPLGGGTGMNDLNSYFSFDRLGFTTLMGFGGGAAAATIVGVLTRNGSYALYAMLIFGLGGFIPLIQNFVLAFPNTAMALIASTGAGTDITGPLLATLGVWVGAWGAMYIFGIIFNREVT